MTSSAISGFTAKAGTSNAFLLHVLLSREVQDAALVLSTGTGQQEISVQSLLGIETRMPPLSVQRRIADLMEHLDTHIANLNGEIAALEQLSQAAADRLWTEASSDGVTCQLGELAARVKNGLMYKRGRASGGLPITRIQTISGGRIDLAAVGHEGFDAETAKGFLLQEGDVLFSNKNSLDRVGTTAMVRRCDLPLINGDNIIQIRADRGVSPAYLFTLLRSRQLRHQLRPMVRPAVNQASVNAGQIRSLKLPWSQQPSTVALAEWYLDALEHVEIVGSEVRTLEALRSRALSGLLSQSITVPESYDCLLGVPS